MKTESKAFDGIGKLRPEYFMQVAGDPYKGCGGMTTFLVSMAGVGQTPHALMNVYFLSRDVKSLYYADGFQLN